MLKDGCAVEISVNRLIWKAELTDGPDENKSI